MKKLFETKDLQIWEMGDGSRFQKCRHTGEVKPYPYKRLGYWAYRKVSDDQIREIWEKYHTGKMSSGKLSKEYGISDRLVMRIVKGLYRNKGGELKDSGIRYATRGGRIRN